MRKSKFTEGQIAFALRQAGTGTPVSEVIRKMGVTGQTHLRWKKKHSGLGPSELRCLRQLEEENRGPGQMVADLGLEGHTLQEVIRKKALRSAQKRELVGVLRDDFRVSGRRACRTLRFARSIHRCQRLPDAQAALRTSPSLRRFHARIKARRGAKDARVATARKLAELAWTVGTEKRSYAEQRYEANPGCPR